MKLSMVLFFLLVSSCRFAPYEAYEEKVIALNGVKIIDENIESGRDSSTFFQAKYNINNKRRLLLRLENLNKYSDEIVIDEKNRLFLKLSLVDNNYDLSTLRENITLCPLNKNWMMLATWFIPHPFGEKWKNPGGDYDVNNCLNFLTYEEIESGKDSEENVIFPDKDSYNSEASNETKTETGNEAETEKNEFFFDVSDWLIHSMISNKNNFGWILVSNLDLNIWGDTSDFFSPRLIWRKKINNDDYIILE